MLKITNLTKIFSPGTINEKLALNNLNLSLERGDFVTIIGSNGAGKSTLMIFMGGVHAADGVKILLDGLYITRLP